MLLPFGDQDAAKAVFVYSQIGAPTVVYLISGNILHLGCLLAASRRQGSSAAKSPERAIFHRLFGQYLDIDTANPAKSVLAQPIFRNDALSPTGC